MENVKDLFMNRCCDILLIIDKDKKDKYLREISQETQYTEVRIPIVINKFEVLGLIIKVKKGRRIYIRLTEKGKKLVEHIKRLQETLEK